MQERIIATLEAVSDEELRVICELGCDSLGRQWNPWWSRDSAEQYIVSPLEAMGLQQLRELAALLEGPAASMTREAVSKAAWGETKAP